MKSGAGNETRTRDPDLGKVVLYQLSYSRASRTSYDLSGPCQPARAGRGYSSERIREEDLSRFDGPVQKITNASSDARWANP